MKINLFFIVLCMFAFSSVAQIPDKEIYDLKAGRVKPDNNYIYYLPFIKGSKFLLIQAYNSKMSHTKELSLDFKMNKG